MIVAVLIHVVYSLRIGIAIKLLLSHLEEGVLYASYDRHLQTLVYLFEPVAPILSLLLISPVIRLEFRKA